MKKRVITFALALIMIIGILPATQADAAGYASGQEIVELAMTYIGKVPYVWGGTTIDGANPGADCSGFICRLYEKFGFNFWANRTKLRNCGTNLGADLSLAEPGDIIWYEGHVAIFAGYDSGHPMIVHCTGGNYQNVIYSRADKVSAELKGVIRIPGVVNNGQTVSRAYFSAPTQQSYVSKQYIGETNAVVVAQITKLSGVKVSSMGLLLYDESGNLIANHSEDVSGIVGNSTTVFHSWYDMNSEVGITLVPGTTYKYQFYGVFDGQEIKAEVCAFTTAGQAPVTSFDAYLYSGLDCEYYDIITVTEGQQLGIMPEPYIPDGYEFKGWFTAKEGGRQVSQTSIYNGGGDVYLYAQYEAVEKTYEVRFHSGLDFSYCDTITVTQGQKLGALPEAYVPEGYNFWGWYTAKEGGGRVGPDTVFDVDYDFDIYARYEYDVKYEPVYHEIVLWLDFPVLSVDGEMIPIDSLGTVPSIINGRTMLPIRAVIEAMGGSVAWDESSKTISLSVDGEELKLRIGSSYAWDSNSSYRLDSAPVIVNGRTLLPVRAVVEYFGGTVSWDGAAKSITIGYEA